MQQHLLRPAPDLKPAPPLPGVGCSPAVTPLCSPCIYCVSHCTYMLQSRAFLLVHTTAATTALLLHHYAPPRMHRTSCTSPRAPHLVHLTLCTSPRAPLRVHLVHLYVCTSTPAPRASLRVHLYACTLPHAHQLLHLYTCTSPREPHLVHITSCTSTLAPLLPMQPLRAPRAPAACTSTVHAPIACTSNHCRGTSRSVTIGTSRAPLVYHQLLHHYAFTSSRVHLSCIICTRAPINLVHPSSPSAIKRDLDHSVSHCYILAISPLYFSFINSFWPSALSHNHC